MRAPSDIVGIGLIGAGSIAAYHIEGLEAAGGASVRAVASRSAQRAGSLASAYGIPHALTDWRRLIERPDVDAVVIATPDHTHREIACAAADAGKAVLLQKPMARTSGECVEIIEAARRARTVLEVSFMHRYFGEVVRAREFLASGAGGPVFSARLRNATPGPDWDDWFYSREKVGGGVVVQIGVHGIDLLRHLLGPIAGLTATTALHRRERVLRDGRRVAPDSEDHAAAIYTFAEGATATHEMSFSEVHGTDRFALEIYCADATLHLRGGRGPLAIHAPWLAHEADGWYRPEIQQARPGARHHTEFLDVVRGRRPPTGTAEDGLASLLVAEAIYRSAERAGQEPVRQPADVLASIA